MFNILTFSIVSGEACCFPGTKTLSMGHFTHSILEHPSQVLQSPGLVYESGLFIQSHFSPVFEMLQIDEDTDIVPLTLLAVGLGFHFHLVFPIPARSLDSEENANHFKDTS